VEKHGIAYHEKTLGQLFCDDSSKDIVAMLLSECRDTGVVIETNIAIDAVSKNDAFSLSTTAGDFTGAAVVVATGGLSIPKMGASGLGYELARQFGLHVYETSAALVPFTFSGTMHELTTRLSGVSTRASISIGGAAFTENILFTHRGLSGPAALQISSYWTPGETLSVNLLPGDDAAELLLAAKSGQPRALLRNVLATNLPRRLVSELQALWWPESADKPLSEMRNDALTDIGRKLNSWTVKPAATEGYRTAEVTLGGVDTDELSSRTMESKKVPGLYFIGEVVDVTGHLGGFNFQWAWSSGHAAGMAV
jgi:predicted Rossmann fold flavoprotein